MPTVELRFQSHLDGFVAWMRDERGFSSSTVVQWRSKIRDFLQWFERADRPFSALDPNDLDAYFVTRGPGVGLASRLQALQPRSVCSCGIWRVAASAILASVKNFGGRVFIRRSRCHQVQRGRTSTDFWPMPEEIRRRTSVIARS